MRPAFGEAQQRIASIASRIRDRIVAYRLPEDATDALPKSGRSKVFRAYLAAEELSGILALSGSAGKRMLDIGGAYGVHRGFFEERHPDLEIDLLDLQPGPVPLIHTGPYETFVPTKPYDVIWASHVVEHLRNPGSFFDQAYRDLAEGGWLCVTVPPLRSRMTLAHVTLWNAGLLLVHLVHAGFDCREARVATYGYNVSVLVQKTQPTNLGMRARLPAVSHRGIYFEGNIERLNWRVARVKELQPRAWFKPVRDVIRGLPRSGFFRAMDDSGRHRLHYFHSPTGEQCRVA